MNKSISQFVGASLQKANIKQLLKFIIYSCSAAIIVLALSTISIEKFAYNSQNKLVKDVLEIEALIRSINNTVMSLILRDAKIELSDDADTLSSITDRDTLENNFNTDIELLKKLLPSEESSQLINNYNKSFLQFLYIDTQLFSKKEKVIYLKSALQVNELALEFIVNDIIDAVDSVSGKIKLKTSRARKKLNDNLPKSDPGTILSHSSLFENLLGQQRRVEEASEQVQLGAIQVYSASSKINQNSQ
jgi:hypothetical protein